MPDTVDQLLRERAASLGDKPAVVDPSARVSYVELDSATRGMGADFVEAGVGKGTRVGLVMPNGVEWACTAMALLRIGAVLVPLSTLLRPNELVAQLRAAGVETLVAVEEFRGRRQLDELSRELAVATLVRGPLRVPALPALQRVWVPHALPEATDAASKVAAAMAGTVAPGDPMVIMFTSGSSGMPKGVMHSHRSALGAVQSSLAPRCIAAGTRLYLPMPFFWVGGFGGGLLSALLAGATLVTEPTPTPESTVELLQRERVTLFRGWPEQAEGVARYAASIGAQLPDLQPGSLDALLPVELRAGPGRRAILFGMTETFGPYCGYAADTDMPPSAWGSCGKPFAGMELRVVDVESGEPCGVGEVGELQVRGPHTLRGVCRRSREDVFTVDGFYATGDLGHLDAEGFMFHHGRRDDMFKVSGATVYPSEVEAALRTLTGVHGAFVTNVPVTQVDRVGAVVVCGQDRTSEELRVAARQVLSSFKVPTVWLVVASDERIPRGATGKVDVDRLRDMLRGTITGHTDQISQPKGRP
jgi:acyl-CoA synthetase (AMP-forming)/AMP-acid ligase II